jgi:predicted Zn-dependent protease
MRAALAQGAADDLDERAERVRELIDAGQLDEAEQLSRQLESDHPDEQVGAECLGMVYEARGLRQVASEHYRRAVVAMDALGEGKFCDCCRARMVKAVRRLDPSGPPLEIGRDPQ